ncbi:MAG: L,D-transpeptidase family protein [Bryobacterales bacterium]|nr:L,D-transpeptidase family protein [Bryobacterales bacterium]
MIFNRAVRITQFAAAFLVLLLFPCRVPGAEGLADKLVVYKSKRELLLYRGGKVLRSYRVALGSNPVGPKQRQGDGRTPEGTYTISGRNAASAFHRSLRISYPNAADRVRARRQRVNPGGDIMIHGLPNGQGFIGAAHRLVDWTDGCIAVTDAEIEEIWRLAPDGTPIRIDP